MFKHKKSSEKSESQGLYLKINPGETVKVILRGEPFEFFSIFENGKSTLVDKNFKGAKWRFKHNVVVKEGESYVMKILEGGRMIADQLEALSQANYVLNETVLQISRKGEKLNTEYTVVPLPGGLNQKVLANIRSLELHDLSPSQPVTPSPIDEMPNLDQPLFDDEEIPF